MLWQLQRQVTGQPLKFQEEIFSHTTVRKYTVKIGEELLEKERELLSEPIKKAEKTS